MNPQREYPDKAGPCLIRPPDDWNDNKRGDASIQLSGSASPADSAFHNEGKESERVTAGDPSWVARPRNAFIIFRCEYARLHSRVGRRIRRTRTSAEKSLSKRAAEAWHQLPSQERDHFKTLADQERREHALLHPDYRFRPAKRHLPKRNPHPRLVSLSDLPERRSDNEAEIKYENGPRQEIISLGFANARDLSDSGVHGTPSPLFSPWSYEVLPDVGSCSLPPSDSSRLQMKAPHWSPPIMKSVIPCPSHTGVTHPLLYSSDFDSGSPSNLSSLQCMPPLPPFCGTANICVLHNPVLLSSKASLSSLANWDGKASDRLGLCHRRM
ncbi:hypothetical protein AX15_002804 [Amanita polypyramis BW_CC]|nr:hypothetical protein AX15_002804 [Amanita polypyramis BW_CC]